MSRRNYYNPKAENIYLKILGFIHLCLSLLFFILHFISIDIVNVLANIEGLNLSNINEYFVYSGQIAIIIFLSFILGFGMLSFFLKKSYNQNWRKLIFVLSLISFFLLSIISIINTYDIAKIFFEQNPIDIINLVPSDTPTYSFRAFMIFLFVLIILLLNIGFLIFIHKKIHPLKAKAPLLLICFIFNLSIIMIFFPIPIT